MHKFFIDFSISFLRIFWKFMISSFQLWAEFQVWFHIYSFQQHFISDSFWFAQQLSVAFHVWEFWFQISSFLQHFISESFQFPGFCSISFLRAVDFSGWISDFQLSAAFHVLEFLISVFHLVALFHVCFNIFPAFWKVFDLGFKFWNEHQALSFDLPTELHFWELLRVVDVVALDLCDFGNKTWNNKNTCMNLLDVQVKWFEKSLLAEWKRISSGHICISIIALAVQAYV